MQTNLLPFIVAFRVVNALIAWPILLYRMGILKRARELEALAPTLGLSFERGFFAADAGPFAAMAGFEFFRRGYNKSIRNVLHGQAGEVFLQVFDYTHTSPTDMERHTARMSVALLTSETTPPLPGMLLYPEYWYWKIDAALGVQDIDFPEFPEFSRLFELRGPDESELRAMIDAPTAAFFEANPGVTVQTAGRHLLFFRSKSHVPPPQTHLFIGQALAVFRKVTAAAERSRR